MSGQDSTGGAREIVASVAHRWSTNGKSSENLRKISTRLWNEPEEKVK
jgi:hypothetical protein